MIHRPDRCEIISALGLAILLVTTFAVYAPGLSGGFLFDDLVNLDALGRLGGIDDWRALIDYLFGSHTGTGGRPVALASFLLDSVDWPADPRPFKYTNILLHLLTMVGVTWLTLQISGALGYDRRRQYAIALLAGAAWGLHPYLVSTVLYIVQRMAILAALFIIFGLSCYVYGRRLLAANRARTGYVWMTLGIAVFTPLAFFSKPNGALLPLLAIILNATVLHRLHIPQPQRYLWRLWRSLFLYLPLAAIVGYFVLFWDDRVLSGYAGRSFTLTERLLTQGRILVDYAFHLLVPRIQTSGLYYDNYTVSTGLLTPPSTLAALIMVLGTAIVGFILRHRMPILSAALLFFLAGHAIESTFIPLELYFEHRNYLPSVLLAFALAVGLVRLFDSPTLDHPRLVSTLAGILVLSIFSSFTLARSQLWGDPVKLALTWETENPASIRVQQQVAMTYMNLGLPQQSSAHIAKAISYHPENSMLRVQHLIPLCVTDRLSRSDIDATADALDESVFNEHSIDQLDALADHAKKGTCELLSMDDVLRLTQAALDHSGVQRRAKIVEKLQYLRGNILLSMEESEAAQDAFRASSKVAINVEGALQMAALMASNEHYGHALKLIEDAEHDLRRADSSLRDDLRNAAIDYEAEIKRMRLAIERNSKQKNVE